MKSIKDKGNNIKDISKLLLFYSNRRIIIVEDSTKTNFYKTLIIELFSDLKDKIVILNGESKKNIISNYNKNLKIFDKNKNIFFILDKDFDDKYIPQHEIFSMGNYYYLYNGLIRNFNFIIWRKYCVENYFLNLEVVYKILKNCTCDNIIDKDEIKKIKNYILFLSKYQLLNQLESIGKRIDIGKFINPLTLEIDILGLKSFLREIRKNKNNLIEVNNRFDNQNDINGKWFFSILILCYSQRWQIKLDKKTFFNQLFRISLEEKTEEVKEMKEQLKKISSSC
ncbi:hypothetical protein KSU13_06105 [Fusobacterium nucleatum]|uniref:hypothetical protein n=1 Tax=Fusobacterium nucleatum TaxID=851 RepID=UPI0030CD7BC1